MASFAERMMTKMGHVQGQGLGPTGAGIAIPIKAVSTKGKSGLGFVPPKTTKNVASKHGPLPPQTQALLDLEASIVSDAVDRSDGLVLNLPQFFHSYVKAERYIEGVLEWKGFRYGVDPQATKAFRNRVKKRVHYEIARLGYDAGAFTFSQKAQIEMERKCPRKNQFGRKTSYHENVNSVETDTMRIEALNFSWPEAFPTLQKAYAYVLRICELHKFKFSHIPSANGKSFRKLVRKTVAHRALEAGEFFIDNKWPSPKPPTLPQQAKNIVKLPHTPPTKAISPRTISQDSAATLIPKQASSFLSTQFSFKCDLSENTAPKTGRELPNPVNIITKIQDLVFSFKSSEGIEDLPRLSLDAPKIVNEISMILEQAPRSSNTASATKVEEKEEKAPEIEVYRSRSVSVGPTTTEQTTRLPSLTPPLETNRVEERAREAKLHFLNPNNMSPISMVQVFQSPSPTLSFKSDKEEDTLEMAELDIPDSADWVCIMLGERIAAAEERSRQFRADETCRDLGKLIAEAENRFSKITV